MFWNSSSVCTQSTSAPFCGFISINLTIDLMWSGLWSTASWEVLRDLESNINIGAKKEIPLLCSTLQMNSWLFWCVGSKRGGAVVRALVSHQCGRVQIPVLTPYVGWVCCWFSPCSERFFSGYSGFPLSLKTNTFKFQFDLERTDTFKRVHMNSSILRG